jgi:hypothetical protein
MTAAKMLMSVGSAIAASKLARSISDVEPEDLLGLLGLSRRRSHVAEDIAFLLTGVVVGAGAALLLAPESGAQTRARIGKELEKLQEGAAEAVREAAQGVKEAAPSLMSRVSPPAASVGNSSVSSASKSHS